MKIDITKTIEFIHSIAKLANVNYETHSQVELAVGELKKAVADSTKEPVQKEETVK